MLSKSTGQGMDALTLDDFMDALTIRGLASLLSSRSLGLGEFNGQPVTYCQLDDGSNWRVKKISGELVGWEGMHDIVSSIGANPVRYAETDGQATLFRGFIVRYVTDQVAGGHPRLLELNGKCVLFNMQQRLIGINGAVVSYNEGVTGLNGSTVLYSVEGNIASINGQPVICEPEKRPSNKDILVLAALFPPPYLQALRQPNSKSR